MFYVIFLNFIMFCESLSIFDKIRYHIYLKNSLVYFDREESRSIQKSYNHIRSIHFFFLTKFESLSSGQENSNHILTRVIRLYGKSMSKKNIAVGNTLAVMHYFDLFESCMRCIAFIHQCGDSCVKEKLQKILKQKFIKKFQHLQKIFRVMEVYLFKIHKDAEKVKIKPSKEDSKFIKFSKKFTQKYFSYSYKTIEHQQKNPIYVTIKLFFLKYMSYLDKPKRFKLWYDGLTHDFGLSKSLRDFLMADSFLTAQILGLKNKFRIEVDKECKNAFSSSLNDHRLGENARMNHL